MAGNEPNTVIVERSRGGMTAIIALVALVIIAATAYFLVSKSEHKDDAISSAAKQVGDAAQDVGDAAKDATRR